MKRYLREIAVLMISIGLFLSIIFLIDFINDEIYITVKRETVKRDLNIFFIRDLLYTVVFSITVYVPIILLYRRFYSLIPILIGLFLYNFSSIGAYYLYLSILVSTLIPISLIWVEDFHEIFIKYFSINIIVFEAFSLIPYIFHPFIGGKIYENVFGKISFLELELCYGLQNIYAIILLIFPYVASIMFLTSIRLRKIRKMRFRIGDRKYSVRLKIPSQEVLDKSISTTILLISIILVFIIVLYPYSCKINPEHRPVGVDIVTFYSDWLEGALKGDPIGEAFNASGGSRPLYLLFTYIFAKIFNLDPLIFNEIYVPIILYLMLVLSTYYLSYKLSNRHDFAALTSFLTITGYQASIGIYSAYYANLMALSLIYLMFGFLTENRFRYIMYACIVSFICNFIHPWTLEQGLLALFSINVIDFLYTRKVDKRLLKKTLPPIFSAFLAEQVKIYMNGVGMVTASTATRTSFTFLRFWTSFKEMNFFVKILYGGYVETPFLLLFIPAIMLTMFLDKRIYRFMFAWTFTLLPIAFYDNIIQSRLYFNYPVGLLISIITLYPCIFFKKYFTKKIYILTIIMVSLNYIFKCMANIYYVQI